jgi:hypothetical protein
MVNTSNPISFEYTSEHRQRLTNALRRDDTLPEDQWFLVVDALRKVPLGTMLPYELPDGSDGETDEERVSIALDYYGVA